FGQLAQAGPVHPNVVNVLLRLRLFGADLGVARSNEILDEHVGSLVLLLVLTVVRHFSLAVRTPTSANVSYGGPKVVQLAARFGQLVTFGAVLRLLHVCQTATGGGLHFAFDGLDLEAIAR